MSESALSAHQLRFSFPGRAVLRDVSFHATGGEFLALLGSNGAGKSTLMDLLAGLRTPDAGEVRLRDRPLLTIPAAERAQLLCHLPQGVRADLPFQVEQIVLMGRYAQADRWMESAADVDAVHAALARADCLALRHRHFSTLSGGERQRVLLAACLAQQARVLLMDEPSTFLDLEQQLHCFRLLKEEASAGALCIAVTHDLNLALAHCSRILVLRGNALEADMPVSEAWNRQDWMRWFSPQLRVETTASGQRWVAYR
ncbi:MAG: ABC transporter ATP-binding protein [Bryobacterales bacterium]|jgi:iron complex transport system ATP-binding protein|nr:ABC transporter ATP-binding protein [Bryobacterales bacterium]